MARSRIQRVDPNTVSQATIKQLTDLINTIYTSAYEGIWPASFLRTNTSQISQMISNGEIFACYHENRLVGTVRLQQLKTEIGAIAEFSLLAVAPEARGTGAGKMLVQYVEREAKKMGFTVMQLEVLVPKELGQLEKGLIGYYGSLGYRRIGMGELPPRVSELLIRTCDFIIFHKEL